MALWQNIPFVCILLPLGMGATLSILPKRVSKWVCLTVLSIVTALSVAFLVLMIGYGQSYTYKMGHYSAPWGNEIRAGVLEAAAAVFFSATMLLSAAGGMRKAAQQIEGGKQSLYYVIISLLTAALMAQIYTNDMFTAYVFVEIMTLAACGLIAARSKGRTLVASTRYMIMNLLGSGLFLLGITLLYDLTGHLLMENIFDAVQKLHATGQYALPLTVVVALMSMGLAIKSALFPFHTWLPDAYSDSTPASSAILSSLVSKGYIFLLIKVYYRVIGIEVIRSTRIVDVLFVFGLVAMVMGSITAIRQSDIRRMVAYSSVAQIGYIYMGIGIGTEAGMVAALFHVFAHMVCKSMLFIAVSGLTDASGDQKHFRELRGSGLRHPLAGVAFTVGAFSMVGIPFFSGFVAKVYFASSAVSVGGARMILVLITLIISTALNTVYFLRTVVNLYRPAAPETHYPAGHFHSGFMYNLAMCLFIALNLGLGVFSQPVVRWIAAGLNLFS